MRTYVDEFGDTWYVRMDGSATKQEPNEADRLTDSEDYDYFYEQNLHGI